MDIIKDFFNCRDQQCILDIPLEEADEEDELYWRLDTTGVYSVKTKKCL